ncbi:hypothetical protein [Methanothrix harundinacea]|jgi:hypothetical protein|uniref:Uncharacterized protein n=1 Tax=Methanothrix harundinacea (strain 6Ac) TaxID=1110509 RepID=G7WM23_METH6|nr:hypothetical protein [Methanothrix harundinacea]AET64398.1 hypothetical protein Mhar_1029 [Methanothrix harundinacea 6Ac]
MTDQIEELREKVLAVLRRNDVKRAAFFRSIVRGEVIREGEGEILVELSGRPSGVARTGAMDEISFDMSC